MREILTLCAVGVLAASAATAHAQTPFRHSGGDTTHATYSPLPNEHIDPASGALTLVATDLVLPGNAGFDLRVTRVYNSSLYSEYDSGSADLDEDSWAGVGWRLHFGRVINPYATTGGTTSIELGDGGRHPLYTTTAYPEGWMSPGFARYDRSNHTLKLPNGLIYTFGHEADLGGTLGVVRYVTEIRDPFNNKLEFSYFAAPGPVDGVSQIRQYLSPTQVRDVNFTYDSGLNTLATMSYNGRTWTYVHAAQGSSGHSVLREVRAPLGPPELYDYTALPGELTRWETPAGGVTTYAYQDAYRKASTLTNRTRVVTQRAVSGRLIQAGTWTFAYGTGSNEDTSVIVCACDGGNYPTRTKYRFHGTGLAGDFSAWLSGALAELIIEQSDGVVVEHQQYTWARSEPLSSDPVAGENGVWADPAVYRALLQSVTTTRGPQNWTTTHEYHPTNFNDFGQPWKTSESGDFTRTTERTFQTRFIPHIVGGVASTWTRIGPEGAGATWEYDLATGFLTSYVGPRSPLRRFVPRTDGNLASEKDALNNETTYENYTWGKPQIIRTPKTRTDLNINDDGTINYGGNAVVVHFNYDDLFRQTKTWSHGVNAVFTHYDNISGTGAWSEQGAATAGVTVDGFGRVIQTNASTGVKARTQFDTCGRTVFSSMPYTAGTGSLGTTPTYDFLGRVSTVTGPDGAITRYTYTGIDVTVTDAEGRQTVYDYSAAGSPAAARLMSVRDAANVTTTYTYDVLDSLVKVSGPGPVPDRTWAYDSLGQLLSDTQPESGTTTYVHDAAGNLTRKTDAKGQIVNFTYDEDSRLKTVDPPGSADDVTITYDIHGRLASQATATTGITFGYNAAGQLASRTDTVGALSFTSAYEYDLNENLAKITYPSGRVVTYEYDAHNRLVAVRQNGNVFADQFAYDDAGRLASYRTGAVTHTLGYDVSGRTKTLTSGAALNLTYDYDRVGNVKTITEPTQPTQQFGYDALNRLTTASGPWGQRLWTYTASGDRTSEIGPGATSYQYDASTRRLQSSTGTRPESFSYDAIGQMVQDGRGTYQYNASGLVTSFTGANVSAAYAYDPAGLRVARTVNDVTMYTVRSSGGTVLTEYRAACGTPVWTRDIIYAGGRLLGSIKANAVEPTVSFTALSATAAEAQGTVTATITLSSPWSGGTPCPITVGYEALAPVGSASGAAKGVDFTLASGSVTFPAGSVTGATRTLTIAIENDTTDEEDETFSVTLSSAVGATLSGLAALTVTITDDDPPPSVSISDVSATEGDTAGVAMVFTVSLSAASGKTVSVPYSFADVTATASADYLSGTGAYTGTVTLEPGVVSQTIQVEVMADLFDEPAEHFDIHLSGPTDATLGDATGRGTILDNDPTPVAVSNVTTKAGKIAQFTLTLARPAEETLTVSYGTADDTAIAGVDYQPTSGVATFTVGSTTRTVNVTTIADAPERDEAFWLSLYSPSAGIGVPSTPAAATIVNRRKGDLNGDGAPDLLWQHTDGTLLAWLMNGVAKLPSGGSAYVDPMQIGSGWQVVGIADFNDDGYQDLLQQHANGDLRIWALRDLLRIDTLTPSVSNPGDTNWKVRGAGDFNGDGHIDIAWQHVVDNYIALWLMNGTTVVASELTSQSLLDATWKISAIADMNADGTGDLVWQHQTEGWLAAWLLNGPTVLSSVSLTPSPMDVLEWKMRGAADYNGDGLPDLLWHHQTSDWIVVWLMNGSVRADAVTTTPYYHAASLWQLVGPR